MEKAILYCPREKLFVNHLLFEVPTLPSYQPTTNAIEMQVDILEVQGEKATILLPNILARGENNTALVDIKYLN